ncbi:MAG: hypothetical protein ACRD72_24015 [Candidatus Angelobacter sp.]
MSHKTLWILSICLCLLFSLGAFAQQGRDPDKRDLQGISPKHHKYIFTVLGGAAAGAGLGFILPGEKTPLKLMLLGGGAGSSWYLYNHRNTLGEFHDWGMIGGNTAMGWGIGWLGCNCRDGAYAGSLLGGGLTAGWEALKNDRAARNTFNRASSNGHQ